MVGSPQPSVDREVAEVGLFQGGPGNLAGGTHTLGIGPAGLGPPPHSPHLPVGLGFGVRSSQSLSGSLAGLDWMGIACEIDLVKEWE